MPKKKASGHEGGGGHDGGGSMRWLLTYADMITLLTAFFIMMYSMSVVNLTKFRQVAISIRSGFGGTLEGGGHSVMKPAPGESRNPAVLPEVGGFQPATVAKQIRRYVKENGLENELRIKSTERGLVVSIVTDKMLFPKGTAEVTPEAAHLLDEVARLIRKTDNHVRVEGHTDNLPIHTVRFPSNWELSTSRATTVVRYLIEHSGLSPARLSAAGYANSRPVVPNDSEPHRMANRRVDIVILDGPERDEFISWKKPAVRAPGNGEGQ